jgi:hypothetical protein
MHVDSSIIRKEKCKVTHICYCFNPENPWDPQNTIRHLNQIYDMIRDPKHKSQMLINGFNLIKI